MRYFIPLVAVLLLSGCMTRLDGDPLEPTHRSGTFYVERQPKDERNLNKDISEQLNLRGLDTSYGETADKPEDVDYTVSYIDRWYWDMRMYLIELRIEVRDRASNIVAYGDTMQTSMAAMGKTHVDIINRALDQMFIEGSDAPAEE